MKLEIDDLERRAIERSLAERRSRLIEMAGDTTLTPARRQASYRELSAIASALRKLRRQIRSGSASLVHRAAHPTDAKGSRNIGRVCRPPPSSIDKLHDLPHLNQKECQRRTQRQGEQKSPNP